MQTRDHKALALKLVGETNNDGLRRHRRAFLLGCVEPDYNLLTYVRGSIHYSAFRGHNAENVQAYIRRCIEELQHAGLRSAFSYFVLGTLLHYVADTFTYPHNTDFSGNLMEHAVYEKKLHQVFSLALSGYTHTVTARQTHSAENFLHSSIGSIALGNIQWKRTALLFWESVRRSLISFFSGRL